MKLTRTLSANQQLTGSLNPEHQIYGDLNLGIPTPCVLRFLSLSAFPSLGSEKFLYVTADTAKSYIWASDILQYICVGSNYEDINIVNGGDSSGEYNT